MSGLDRLVRDFFASVDRKDFDLLLKQVDRNAEGVDEISRKWIRGKRAFAAYFKRVAPQIKNIKSTLRGLHTREVGSVGIATCFLHQSYTLSGRRQIVGAGHGTIPRTRIEANRHLPLPVDAPKWPMK